MTIIIILADNKTGGAVPIECEAVRKGNMISLLCKGAELKDMEISLPAEPILELMSDELHG